MSLADKILEAGVVGAGGAGFPSHVKANSKVEYVLANGAECEPLLHKDFEIMCKYPKEIVDGMNLMIESTNADKGYFGIKSKNVEAVELIEKELEDTKIEMSFLGDFYPSGDEYELVYEATKRLMPAHGIPLDVGCVVNNVETLYNISKANNGIPVTEKFLCVAGAVKNPSSFFVPIGTSLREVLEHAGGATIDNYACFVSGIMMGKLVFDLDQPVTKATAGIIILPVDHYLVKRNERPTHDMNRIGKSACDQCSYCTEFCPRYLLGYDVQPHKVMRSLVFSKTGDKVWNQFADLCCSCGLCSLYSCPEDLYPREACDQGKAELKSRGEKYEQKKEVKVHPIKEGRRVPIKMLMKKLSILQYDAPTPFNKELPQPSEVNIVLNQHIGTPAKSLVSVGDKVSKGAKIASVDEGQLGTNIHSSIDGEITFVTSDFIRIKK